MAKAKANKSQAIRDYFKSHRKASAKEVVAALKEQGITVTEGLVYQAKRKIKRRRKKRLAAVAVASRNSHADPVALVHETKALAQKVGGVKSSWNSWRHWRKRPIATHFILPLVIDD